MSKPPFRNHTPDRRRLPRTGDRPIRDRVVFGGGTIGVAPGIVQVNAPDDHQFLWTRAEALALARVLEGTNGDHLAALLRSASKACVAQWAGARHDVEADDPG